MRSVARVSPQGALSIDMEAESQVLTSNLFGEGIAVWRDETGAHGGAPGEPVLLQLTWMNHVGFVYNAATFERLREIRFSTTRNQGEMLGMSPTN